MADVFLSYSRHDQQVADLIDERLRSGGRSVFLDRRRLEANAPWEPVLEGELQAARCVLVLWSTASIESQWVRKEANSGYMRKRLVQALIHKVNPPQPFAGLQAVNLIELADYSLADLTALTQAIDGVIRLPAGAPDEVGKELDSLVLRLDQFAPQKQFGENLMIATWNIRALGGLTRAWTATEADTPKRDRRSIIAIAEIVRRFDLTVLQEVRGDDLEAFNYLMTILGEEWSGLTLESDSNPSSANGEMTALIFDARRIMPRGLFDRLMPLQELGLNGSQDLDQLLLNRPYGAFFRTRITDRPTTFGIIILRVLYGHRQPVEQLSRLAAWLREWATAEESAGRSLMLVGDFGIDRLDDPAYQALRGAGLWVPPELDSAPRTIFGKFSPHAFVDHIAFMRDDDGEPIMSLTYTGRGGFIDFMESVYSKVSSVELSWRISDHYPIWLELSTGHRTKEG